MSKKLTLQEASERVLALSEGALEVVEYTKASEACTLRRTDTGELISCSNYPNALKRVRTRGYIKTDRHAELARISSNRYRLIEYSRTALPCIIEDTNTGERITIAAYNNVIQNLKRNPDHVFSSYRVAAQGQGSSAQEDFVYTKSKGKYSLEEYTHSHESCVIKHIKTGKTKQFSYNTVWRRLMDFGSEAEFDMRTDVEKHVEDVYELSDGRYELKSCADPVVVEDTYTGTNYQYTHLGSLKQRLKKTPVIGLTSTTIEHTIETLLQKCRVHYARNTTIKAAKSFVRPDFLIEDHKLVIECDGLYWHSEEVLNRNGYNGKKYHTEKLLAYENAGYTALFFREDEINNSLPIVESIILNKLGLSSKIYARKCTLGTTTKAFFEENHLMGKGSGKIFALLHEGEPVAAIQVRWKKKWEVLDISRFCTKMGISVVGGFSKLLKAVEREYNPPVITNFVDRRYGQGTHLEKLGFVKETEYPSFRWADRSNLETHHRMNFCGNKGLTKGLTRIWDCGQAKYVKTTTPKIGK